MVTIILIQAIMSLFRYGDNNYSALVSGKRVARTIKRLQEGHS